MQWIRSGAYGCRGARNWLVFQEANKKVFWGSEKTICSMAVDTDHVPTLSYTLYVQRENLSHRINSDKVLNSSSIEREMHTKGLPCDVSVRKMVCQEKT